MKKTIYLASPYGFSAQWKEKLLPDFVAALEALEQRFEGETVLVVSHGDPLQILLTALAGKPLTKHREQPALLPASITLVGG